DTNQHEAPARSGQTQRSAGKHPAWAAWETGRRCRPGRFSGLERIRLRHGVHVFRRRRAFVELPGAIAGIRMNWKEEKAKSKKGLQDGFDKWTLRKADSHGDRRC